MAVRAERELEVRATRDTTPAAFITPLTEGRPNLGAQARVSAEWMGFEELSDWQYDFLCLATEYEEGNPQDGIVPYWRYLTLTVPRQCGKSELVCTVLYHLRWLGLYKQDGDPKMVYTAHSLEAALDQWNGKIGKRFRESAWGRQQGFYLDRSPVKLHARLGGKKNLAQDGGRVRILANAGKSGRGGTEDMVVMDEVREFGDDSSREKTLDPLMNMRPSPQMVFTSTMGVETSGYFNRKVSAGREAVRQQRAGVWPAMRMAYAEWGVGDQKPDAYDPADKGLWLRSHPMLGWGHWTLERMTEKYDIANSEDDVARFQQEYLNQMFQAADDPAIPWAIFEAVERKRVRWEDIGSPAVLAVYAEPDSYYLSAAVAGNGHLKVVRPVEEAGEVRRVPTYGATDWLTGYLQEYPQIKEVVFQEGNDLEAVLGRFRLRGRKMRSVRFPDYKEGCRLLKQAVVTEQVVIERSHFLRIAIQAAETLDSLDNSTWYWAKKKDAQAPTDELKACVLAWLHYDRMVNRPRAGSPDLAKLAGAGEPGAPKSEWQKERMEKWKTLHGRS